MDRYKVYWEAVRGDIVYAYGVEEVETTSAYSAEVETARKIHDEKPETRSTRLFFTTETVPPAAPAQQEERP